MVAGDRHQTADPCRVIGSTRMGVIRIFDAALGGFSHPVDVYPANVVPMVPDAELEGSRVRLHHPGSEDEPQLFEVEVDPGLELASHAHESAEIIVVTAGGLWLGRRRLTAGSSIMIPGHTLYSLKAGPEGATFLNFRGSADYTYMDPAGFMDARERSERNRLRR